MGECEIQRRDYLRRLTTWRRGIRGGKIAIATTAVIHNKERERERDRERDTSSCGCGCGSKIYDNVGQLLRIARDLVRLIAISHCAFIVVVFRDYSVKLDSAQRTQYVLFSNNVIPKNIDQWQLLSFFVTKSFVFFRNVCSEIIMIFFLITPKRIESTKIIQNDEVLSKSLVYLLRNLRIKFLQS